MKLRPLQYPCSHVNKIWENSLLQLPCLSGLPLGPIGLRSAFPPRQVPYPPPRSQSLIVYLHFTSWRLWRLQWGRRAGCCAPQHLYATWLCPRSRHQLIVVTPKLQCGISLGKPSWQNLPSWEQDLIVSKCVLRMLCDLYLAEAVLWSNWKKEKFTYVQDIMALFVFFLFIRFSSQFSLLYFF